MPQSPCAVQLALIYAPITMLLARFAVGPKLSTWTLIWFNVIFEVSECRGTMPWSWALTLHFCAGAVGARGDVLRLARVRDGVQLRTRGRRDEQAPKQMQAAPPPHLWVLQAALLAHGVQLPRVEEAAVLACPPRIWRARQDAGMLQLT